MKRIIFALALDVFLVPAMFAADATPVPTVLDLPAAERMALQNHPQIAAANYSALAAQEVVTATRAGFFPVINAYGNAVGAETEDARILAGGLNNPSIYDRVAGGLSASLLLCDFGRTANLTAGSQLQAQAQRQTANATREQVLLQVQASYFGALQAQAVRRVAQQTVDTRQLLLDQVSVLASNKLKSELDVSFARVAVQEGRLLLQKAQNDEDNAMSSLSTALGLREPHLFQLADATEPALAGPGDVSQLVETALAQRPELLSLRQQQAAAQKFARAQREARLPVVSAVGLLGDSPAHDSHLPDNYEVGGIQVTLPLFAGGAYRARQHEAELQAQADQELTRVLENNIVRDVHIAWQNVNTAFAQLRTTTELVQSAVAANELAQARYQLGSSSIVELSQAQLSLTAARIAEATARYHVLIQQANLRFQTGSLR